MPKPSASLQLETVFAEYATLGQRENPAGPKSSTQGEVTRFDGTLRNLGLRLG